MDEIKKELENAYSMISRIRVAGDDVDVVAAARVCLRRCYALADKGKAAEKKDKGGEEK